MFSVLESAVHVAFCNYLHAFVWPPALYGKKTERFVACFGFFKKFSAYTQSAGNAALREFFFIFSIIHTCTYILCLFFIFLRSIQELQLLHHAVQKPCFTVLLSNSSLCTCTPVLHPDTTPDVVLISNAEPETELLLRIGDSIPGFTASFRCKNVFSGVGSVQKLHHLLHLKKMKSPGTEFPVSRLKSPEIEVPAALAAAKPEFQGFFYPRLHRYPGAPISRKFTREGGAVV